MAAQDPPHVPPPPPVHRAPEWVGPEHRRTDVSSWSDRQLIVQAFNKVLVVEATLEALLKQANLQGARITVLEGRIEQLEAGGVVVPGAPSTGFDGEEPGSYTDLRERYGTAALELYRRLKDPRDPTGSERARAIADEAVAKSKGQEARAELERQAKFKGQVMVGLIIGIGTAVAIAVGGIAWGVIRQQAAHDQGVAEAEQRLAPVVVQAPPPMPPMPAATTSVAPPATAPAEAAPPHR